MARPRTSKKTDDRYVALLRGINVGGKNKVPMKALAAMFEAAGCRDVATYIQSGNVVFRVAKSRATRVPHQVQAALADELGLTVPVVTRTADELRQAVAKNPFPEATEAPKTLHLGFLAERPTRAAVGALDPDRSPPDRFEVRGRELYLHCPNGVAKTKLTNAYFDRTLGTVSTMRNWRTVLTLLGMIDAL